MQQRRRHALQHALTHGRNQPAYLDIGRVSKIGRAFFLSQSDGCDAANKSRGSLPFNRQLIRLWCVQIRHRNGPVVGSPDGGNPDLEDRLVAILTHRFQALAAGNATGEDRWVHEQAPDPLPVGGKLSNALNLH
jgi:hypothetical protein